MGTGRAEAAVCEFAEIEDLAEWDAARMESNQADFFNGSLLLSAFHRHLFPIAAIAAKRKGRIIGGCYGWDRTIGKKRVLQHPPTLGQGTIWVRDSGLRPSVRESMARDVSAALMEFIPRHFDRVHLSASVEFPATMWFLAGGWEVQHNHTYRFPMMPVDDAWNVIASARRRQVKIATKAGYTAGKSDDWKTMAKVFVAMMKRRGMPCPSVDEFMKTLVERIHGEGVGQLYVAQDKDGYPVTALIVVWDGDKASLYLGATDEEHMRSGVTTLLYWELIKSLCEEGKHRFLDLYGTGLEGIGVYKKHFNAEVGVGADIMFTADPKTRLCQHLAGAWIALKHVLTRRRFGSTLDLHHDD